MRSFSFLAPVGTVSIVLTLCHVGLVASQDLIVPHAGYGQMGPALVPYTYAPGDPEASSNDDNEEDGDEEDTTVDPEIAKVRQSAQELYEKLRTKRQAPYSMFPLPPPADWTPPEPEEATAWRQPFDIPPPLDDPVPLPEGIAIGATYGRRRLSRKKANRRNDSQSGLGSTSGVGLDEEYNQDNTDNTDEDPSKDSGRDEDRDDEDNGSKRKKREAGWNGGPSMQGNFSMGSVHPYPGAGHQLRSHEQRENSRYMPERSGPYNRHNQTVSDRPRGPQGPDRGSQHQGPQHAASGYRENVRMQPPQSLYRETPRYDSGRPERQPNRANGRMDEQDEDRSPYGKDRGGKYNSRKEDEDDDDKDDDDNKYDSNENGGPKQGGSRENHTGGKEGRDRSYKGNEHGNCKDKKMELEKCVLKILLSHPHELYDSWYRKSTVSGRELLRDLREKTQASKSDYRSDISSFNLSNLIWHFCEVIEEKQDGRPNGRPDGKPDGRNQGQKDSRDYKKSPSSSAGVDAEFLAG